MQCTIQVEAAFWLGDRLEIFWPPKGLCIECLWFERQSVDGWDGPQWDFLQSMIVYKLLWIIGSPSGSTPVEAILRRTPYRRRPGFRASMSVNAATRQTVLPAKHRSRGLTYNNCRHTYTVHYMCNVCVYCACGQMMNAVTERERKREREKAGAKTKRHALKIDTLSYDS